MDPLQVLKKYWEEQNFNKVSTQEIAAIILKESLFKMIRVFRKK